MGSFNLQSAIVPVTGAASGIGLAICKRLRAEGATPLLIDFDKPRLQAAAKDVFDGSDAASHYSYVVDVRDSLAVDACVVEMIRSHGRVTHAVANAGTGGTANILNVTDEQWHRVVDVNVHGVMYFCRAVARQLAERKSGSIVTIASIAGLSATKDRVSYAASKAAVINLTRALAVDLGGLGVRANAVAPGVIDTPMQDRNRATLHATSEGVPLKRIGTADEVANAAVFLLSDLASYITSATLVVTAALRPNIDEPDQHPWLGSVGNAHQHLPWRGALDGLVRCDDFVQTEFVQGRQPGRTGAQPFGHLRGGNLLQRRRHVEQGH
jgi:3-oxoacyl-[acyl-carrier protein] reductase